MLLWKFRYRDKFTAHEATCEAPSYDLMVTAAKAWCVEREFSYIVESVSRVVLFSVDEKGARLEHDPTGKPVEKPAIVAKAKSA